MVAAWRRVFVLIYVLAVAGIQPVFAEGKGDAILILDASGSMWGQIPEGTKIVEAKEASVGIVDKWPQDVRLGLMSYGHRKKGDCQDIELLAAPGAADMAGLKSMIEGLQPRGKTPISDSLRAAAAELKGSEAGATIILVSDGIETCNADPCAVAVELKAAQVNLVAHVIGFDIRDPAARRQLACIAGETGGVYLDARDASGLTTALEQAAVAAQGQPVAVEPAVEEEEPVATFNLTASARLSEDTDPLTDGEVSEFYWFVHEADPSRPNGASANEVATSRAINMAVEVPPGDYVVQFRSGDVGTFLQRWYPVTVTADGTAHLDAVLDAAFVTSVGAIKDGESLDGVEWRIKEDLGGGKPGLQEYFDTKRPFSPKFLVNPDSYVMELKKGGAVIHTPFTVSAGDSINVSMVLDAGTIGLKAFYAPGKPIEDKVEYAVFFPPDASGEEPRGDLVPGAGGRSRPEASYDLPSGSYVLEVRVGGVKRYLPFEIESGKSIDVDVNLDAGVVTWKQVPDLRNVQFYDAANPDGIYLIERTSGHRMTTLPAGDILAVISMRDDTKREVRFKVVAGEEQEINLAGQ
jgi:Ca-activated chloride channel homolog